MLYNTIKLFVAVIFAIAWNHTLKLPSNACSFMTLFTIANYMMFDNIIIAFSYDRQFLTLDCIKQHDGTRVLLAIFIGIYLLYGCIQWAETLNISAAWLTPLAAMLGIRFIKKTWIPAREQAIIKCMKSFPP